MAPAQTAPVTAPPTIPSARVAALPGTQPIRANPPLQTFFQNWSAAVLDGHGAPPLEAFYADAVQFRRSGRLADAAAIARYFAAGAAHGNTFTIDRDRSTWESEPLSSADATRACLAVPGAERPIAKVRAWATEVAPNRATDSGGDVPCARLEGVYLFRLRHVAGTWRICHETWSLREGVCASCPAARQCQAMAPAAPTGCIYVTHSTIHLRSSEVVSRLGAEEIATRPQVQVVRAGSLRRGSEGTFYVRFLDGTGREGWMFIPLTELGPGCPTI